MSNNGFSDFAAGSNADNQKPSPKWYDDLPPEQIEKYGFVPVQQPVRPVQPPPQYTPQPPPPAPVQPQPQPPTYQSFPPPQPVYTPPPAQPIYAPPLPQTFVSPPPPVIPQRKRKKSSGRAFVSFAVILTIIAGTLGNGIPAYEYISQGIASPYIPSVGAGDTAPSVGSTDLSTAIWAAEQVVTLASGKVDSSLLQSSIDDANALLSSTSPSDEELGESQSILISRAEDVKRLLRASDIESVSNEVKRKLAAGEFHSGATREDDVRNMLDTLGGTDIGIIYRDNPCDLEEAAGCVSSEDPTVMYISPLILDKNYYEDYMLLQTIAHEYGHTVHFRTGYYRVFNDPAVSAAFNDDPEYLADCMAQDIEGVVFTTYGYSCSENQLVAARNVWTGNLTS